MKPVVVISYPRSGTHFVANTLARNFGYRVPVRNWKGRWEVLGDVEDWDQPEVVRKSHHQATWLVSKMEQLFANFHVIYVIRDPRAVVASSFHYFNQAPPETFPHTASPEELLEVPLQEWACSPPYFLQPAKGLVDQWQTHIATWETFFPRLLVVRYEELSTDFDHGLATLAEWLEMEKPEVTDRPKAGWMSVAAWKGEVDGWREALSEETANRILESVTPRASRWVWEGG